MQNFLKQMKKRKVLCFDLLVEVLKFFTRKELSSLEMVNSTLHTIINTTKFRTRPFLMIAKLSAYQRSVLWPSPQPRSLLKMINIAVSLIRHGNMEVSVVSCH
jgi:hypothetical protein